jgi:hypothetical protein
MYYTNFSSRIAPQLPELGDRIHLLSCGWVL